MGYANEVGLTSIEGSLFSNPVCYNTNTTIVVRKPDRDAQKIGLSGCAIKMKPCVGVVHRVLAQLFNQDLVHVIGQTIHCNSISSFVRVFLRFPYSATGTVWPILCSYAVNKLLTHSLLCDSTLYSVSVLNPRTLQSQYRRALATESEDLTDVVTLILCTLHSQTLH